MKRLSVVSFVWISAFLMIFIGCSTTNEENNSLIANDILSTNTDVRYEGPPRLAVTFFDKPALKRIEHLYLDVQQIGIHMKESIWRYKDVDTTIDFLELVNGVTVTLFDDTIPEGYYTQIRLILGQENLIVVDSVTHKLTVPCGEETGIKLNLDFEIRQDEFVHLYVDFDVSESVICTGNGYKLKPTYRVFKQDVSATLAGTVTDNNSLPLAGILINAHSDDYNTATYTDSTGGYMFILPEGTYDIAAVADSGSLVNKTYTGVTLQAGDALTGYDFVITTETVVSSGFVSGFVVDTLGNPFVAMVSIDPTSGSDFIWTDSSGYFEFEVPAGTYDIYVTPPPGFVVDTMYTGVVLAAGDTLSEFKFIISHDVTAATGPGVITGSVLNSVGMPFPIMLVSAISSTDTVLAGTNPSGIFTFVLEPDIYDIIVLPNLGMTPDTSYSGVVLSSGDTLSGYNFIVQ